MLLYLKIGAKLVFFPYLSAQFEQKNTEKGLFLSLFCLFPNHR
jgi:hypothetical protein